MGNTRIRAGFRVAAAIAALALPLAVAGNAFADPPGDNGDVKIHQVGVADPEQDNDPHVCKFYLDAFNFDHLQLVSWTIEGQAPGGSGSLSGAITLVNGDGHTGTLSLPDGHYKLDWTFVGENGSGKHKVFWVGCNTPAGGTSSSSSSPSGSHSSSGSTSGGGTSGGSTSGGSTGGTTTHPTSTSSPSTPKSTSSTSAPSDGATSPSTTSTGKLAHTGADGSALIYAVVGAAVLAGGGYGLRRYATTRGKA